MTTTQALGRDIFDTIPDAIEAANLRSRVRGHDARQCVLPCLQGYLVTSLLVARLLWADRTPIYTTR